MMDFTKKIGDLMTAGLTQEAVAKLVGARQSTISDLYRGVVGEPKYGLGARIVALHRKVCKHGFPPSRSP